MTSALLPLQTEFNTRIDRIPLFRAFPPKSCLDDLRSVAIELQREDVTILLLGLERIGASADLQISGKGRAAEKITREKEIINLVERLRGLIAECDSDNGWRHAAWNDDVLDFEQAVDLHRLDEDLDILAQSSRDRSEQIMMTKQLGLGPGSGSAPPVRYFYWMTLLAFWEYWLWRNPVPSGGTSAGPVADFVRIMTKTSNEAGEFSDQGFRQFVRRHRKKVRRFAQRFIPRHIIETKGA